MLYGDLVTLTSSGVMLGSQAMLPIGIFDQSICWGVWVPDASSPDEEHNSHLVISSLHPRYWPYLLRFELKLQENVGAMAAASDMLRRHGMNIQFGESSPSGHHHATWNVVCEAVGVRRLFEQRLDSFRQQKEHWLDREGLNALATELAAAMYGAANAVRDCMLEDASFLHPRIVNQEPELLHRPSKIADEAVRKAAMEDVAKPVRVRWIQNLPVFAFYGVDAAHPHAFIYDRQRSILRAKELDIFNKVMRTQGLQDLPIQAVASIYPEEHHVRLLPVRNTETLRQMVQIDLTYHADFFPSRPRPSKEEQDTSIGLWSDTCKKLARHGVNLKRVTNKTVRHEPSVESGVLTLIGVQEGQPTPFAFENLDADLRTVDRVPGRTITIEKSTVRRLTVEKVFISWRMEAPESGLLIEAAKDRARYYGLQPVVVDPPHGEYLGTVITQKIRECDALFQIVTLTQEEHATKQKSVGQSGFVPDLQWLTFEYGVAAGHDIPVALVVDESAYTLEQWQQIIRVSYGVLMSRFSQRQSSKYLEHFDAPMRRLAGRVYGHLDPED